MSRVAKYRRQVSEDPDIDSLLSTLSPEEMEELEKELDNGDSVSRLAVGLRQRNQTDKVDAVTKEAENQIKIRNEGAKSSEDVNKIYSKKDARHIAEKNKETCPKNMDVKQKSDLVKNQKKENCFMESSQMEKEERQSQINDQPKETFAIYTEKERVTKTGEKIPTDEKQTPAIGNKKPTNKRGEDNRFHRITDKTEKPAEKKELKGNLSKAIDKGGSKIVYSRAVEEKPLALKVNQKDTGKKKSSAERTIDSADKDKTSTSDIAKIKNREVPEVDPEQLTANNSTDQNSDDEATSIFDESLEKVKNNDPELTELNVNNSDCITTETLMSFTEALEFNTVVKVFALANTRADDHIALAIAAMLKSNNTLTSINLDSNHITSKGILSIFRALQHNITLTELRFHNQRHICGGKTEMEIAKMLKENTTLLKLGYHFELAGPRMTVTNLLSRNMDKQRQKRLQKQKQAQVQEGVENKKEENKNLLEVHKFTGLPKGSPKRFPKPSSISSPWSSPTSTPKKGGIPTPPPPPPSPFAPLAPPLINENIQNSLSPASQRKMVEKANPSEKNSRDQLLDAIRCNNIKKLKKVELPKLLQ